MSASAKSQIRDEDDAQLPQVGEELRYELTEDAATATVAAVLERLQRSDLPVIEL